MAPGNGPCQMEDIKATQHKLELGQALKKVESEKLEMGQALKQVETEKLEMGQVLKQTKTDKLKVGKALMKAKANRKKLAIKTNILSEELQQTQMLNRELFAKFQG